MLWAVLVGSEAKKYVLGSGVQSARKNVQTDGSREFLGILW